MARVGLPSAPEVEITGAALNSLLETLAGGVGAHHPQAAAPQPAASAEAEDEQDLSDLAIKDSVLQDLAGSLSRRRR
jgi:hypothetical protein